MGNADTDVRFMKGVGDARAKVLNKLGIITVRDLVLYFPRAYEDRTHFSSIMSAPLEEYVCIRAMVSNTPTLNRIRQGMQLVKLRAVDDSGSIEITFFNQVWVRNQLHPGNTYIFYGKLSGTYTKRTMTNPEWEPDGLEKRKTGRILPKYALSHGISNQMMIGFIRTALDIIGNDYPESLPISIAKRYNLSSAQFSFENIHFPADFNSLELARKRLIFEELFTLTCAMGLMQISRHSLTGLKLSTVQPECFYSSLPFSPTNAQKRAISQALSDMSSGTPMNRLIQGDVGSGKTLVAACCAWAACQSGKQVAFMAPTEILAEQHLATVKKLVAPFGLRVEKLTGSMTAKQKHIIKNDLAKGKIDIIIGTHALLTADVQFSDLALVITDEQHRFGVVQRSTLTAKGHQPHVLVMSATPIPRTLALIIYGDLDISILDELPPGRQKVDTYTIDESYRQRLYGFIEKVAKEGHQVFIICPMVEENEEYDPNLKSAVEYTSELQSILPQLSINCIHGRMKAKDKDAVMADVINGKIDVLVSTTVIEVGVDVPNASLIIIENADRFGLSQLHQLRGRVGRGSSKSWCILVSETKKEESKARLKILCETCDGFKISEEDLRLRGPGDFFGKRQHGLPVMHIADLCGDMRILQTAQSAANELLKEDPKLKLPENQHLLAQINRTISANLNTIN